MSFETELRELIAKYNVTVYDVIGQPDSNYIEFSYTENGERKSISVLDEGNGIDRKVKVF